MLERKTLHLQGKVNTKEKEALEKRASDLAEALEEKKRTAATLKTQLKKLQVRVCFSAVILISQSSPQLWRTAVFSRHTGPIHR